MTATGNYQPAVLLCRAALLAGILAVLGGILGMHVMTGNHAAHTLGAAPPSSSASAPANEQSHGGHSENGHSEPAASTRSAVACTCSSASMEVPGAGCTPSVKTASLIAPAPGIAGQVADAEFSSRATGMRSYAYLPVAPSPGDLSISRT